MNFQKRKRGRPRKSLIYANPCAANDATTLEKPKLGRPRRKKLIEIERDWVRRAYAKGVTRKLLATCLHVDGRDLDDEIKLVSRVEFNMTGSCFEEKFLSMFDREVRLKFDDFLEKFKSDSIACDDCRLSVLFSPTNLDLDWCYHSSQISVTEHVTNLRDLTIVGTWNDEWVKDLPFCRESTVTILNSPDDIGDLPFHKVFQRVTFET